MLRQEVFSRLIGEREYQIRRWGVEQPDGCLAEKYHELPAWITFMRDYLDTAQHLATTLPDENQAEVLDAMRKVVTLGIAAFEQHGLPFRLGGPVINGRNGKEY